MNRSISTLVAMGVLMVGCSSTPADDAAIPVTVNPTPTSATAASSTNSPPATPAIAPTSTSTTTTTTEPSSNDPWTRGFTAVFMGHSFFEPPALRLEKLASRAGVPNHTQTFFFGGGNAGAPEEMWNDGSRREEIRRVLAAGDVDLVGMTYHPSSPNLTGYRLWIDEALSHNPNTAFFVGMPWLLDPASMTAEQYGPAWQKAYGDTVVAIVRRLQDEHPFVPIFAVPYGRSAADLYRLFEAGELTEVDSLIGDNFTSLFTDGTGHAGEMIQELSALVWLRSIYCIDVTNLWYQSWFMEDLKSLATAIVDEDDPALAAPWCRAA